jgi:hypothetical protein
MLTGIRDEIVEIVLAKKQNAVLTFEFGTLNLGKNGTIEFKAQANPV